MNGRKAPAPGGLKFEAGGRLEMPKRRDFLERLATDDPNYEVGKRFYHAAWAASHGLVAEGLSGRISLSDFIEGCIRTFEQGAQAHIACEDAASIPARCRELDAMAKKSTRKFSKAFASQSKGLGKANTTAAINEFTRRVKEIAARSKQRIHEKELARSAQERGALADGVVTPLRVIMTPGQTAHEPVAAAREETSLANNTNGEVGEEQHPEDARAKSQNGIAFVPEQQSAPEMITAQEAAHYRNWESSHVSQVLAKDKKKPKGKAGRPPEGRTGEIHAAWIKLGTPEITAAICDKIGKQFFTDELKGFKPGSAQHKKVRERIRQAINRARRSVQSN
jgi:hypothetical protein